MVDFPKDGPPRGKPIARIALVGRTEQPPIKYFVTKGGQPARREIYDLLREDPIDRLWPIRTVLGRLGDKQQDRPVVTEFACELKCGLMALFRRDTDAISSKFSPVPADTHAFRQHSAHQVSLAFELEKCAASVIRTVSGLGRGTMTAAIAGKPFLFAAEESDGRDKATPSDKGKKTTWWVRLFSSRTEDRPEKPEANIKTRRKIGGIRLTSFAEALVFDLMVGSGQRSETTYLLCDDMEVRSQYHHEAFSYTDEKSLEIAFRHVHATVSREFIAHLQRKMHNRAMLLMLQETLLELVGKDSDRFFYHLERVTKERMFGSTRILFPGETDDSAEPK